MRRKRFYRSSGATSDMSVSSIVLTLVLLGTIVAGHTDHPVFWLLVGPAPLGIGFTLLASFLAGVRHNGGEKNKNMSNEKITHGDCGGAHGGR